MMKKIVYILLLSFYCATGSAQLNSYTFEQAEALSKSNPKPLLVFTYTSWCKYCEIMKHTTFKNVTIIDVINKNYYFIPLNAEENRAIVFRDKKFVFKKTGVTSGVHQLAEELAGVNGEIVYPTTTILDTKNTILLQQHSLIDAKSLLTILERHKILIK